MFRGHLIDWYHNVYGRLLERHLHKLNKAFTPVTVNATGPETKLWRRTFCTALNRNLQKRRALQLRLQPTEPLRLIVSVTISYCETDWNFPKSLPLARCFKRRHCCVYIYIYILRCIITIVLFSESNKAFETVVGFLVMIVVALLMGTTGNFLF